MAEKENSSPPPLSGLVGFALIALCAVGIVSAFCSILALNKSQPDYIGGALLLIASAISFGQLLNGLLRK
jgi:hypothetical protein